jgi:hypothetical protein
MELQELGEIYHRIGENVNGRRLNDDEPAITIIDGEMIAASLTVVYSRRIPERGFVFDDILRMSARLRVRMPWLADQLDRPEFGGAAGPYVSQLAVLNRIDVNAIADAIIREADAREALRPVRAPTLSVIASVPDEEVCVICIKTKSESMDEDWATALGCESHTFHSACIQHWARTSMTCPTCRAPLS